MSGEQFILRARDPYSLEASARFLEGFAPAAQAPADSSMSSSAEAPTRERLEAIAESWRPFRSWIAFLLRVSLEDATHEIAEGR